MQEKEWSTTIGELVRQAVLCSSQWLSYSLPSEPHTTFWCFLQRRWHTHCATLLTTWHSLPLPQYCTRQGSVEQQKLQFLLLLSAQWRELKHNALSLPCNVMFLWESTLLGKLVWNSVSRNCYISKSSSSSRQCSRMTAMPYGFRKYTAVSSFFDLVTIVWLCA